MDMRKWYVSLYEKYYNYILPKKPGNITFDKKV